MSMAPRNQRASFYRDVSRSEVLYYRENEGMSNSEIAKRFGVSHKMIFDLIGPQPTELDRRKRRTNNENG